MALFSRLVHAVGDVMVAVGIVLISVGNVLASSSTMSSMSASDLESHPTPPTTNQESRRSPSPEVGEDTDSEPSIDTLDRETLFFGATPEKRELLLGAYKDWAEKHYPVGVLPSACVPPRPESPSDMEYVEKGRPLLHYGIGFRMDEVVRFTTEHNRLEAPIRSSLAGMHSAESLADYLSVKAHANITVERPLSMEYDWVLAWQNTSDLFRKPGITKSARKVIDEEVQKIVGEARKPLWWWDDANTLPRSDPQGN